MPYVIRTESGEISGLLKQAEYEGQEYLSGNHKEVLAFLETGAQSRDVALALQNSDLGLVRATEDLINLLVEKNVILFTELPLAVQEKLIAREKLRAHLDRTQPNSPITDDDTI